MDTFQGVNRNPVTLHKYLYATANPVMYVDPSGMFFSGGLSGFSVAQASQLSLVVGAVAAYGIGQSVAVGGSRDGGFTDLQLGWIQIAAMVGSAHALYQLVVAKLDARSDANQVIDLFRAVEDPELADLYLHHAFRLAPAGVGGLENKQFLHTEAEAIQMGLKFIETLGVSRFHTVRVTISLRFYNSLDHFASEPEIGPIVTVPAGLLPAFNLEINRHGGWVYLHTFVP